MTVYVSDDFLVDVNVNVNTAVAQTPTFQDCLIVCVIQNAFVPTSFGTSLVKRYANYAAISADFSSKEQSAIASGETLQANRIHLFLETCFEFFNQSPTPSGVQVGLAKYTNATPVNYATSLTAIADQNNAWYGFSIADQILPESFSYCIVDIVCTAATTIPKGTVVLPVIGTTYYTALEDYVLTASSYPTTFHVPFYSTDPTTTVPGGTFTSISPAIATVSSVANSSSALNNCAGIMTGPGNLSGALSTLRGAYGPKKCFLDTDNPAYAGTCQTLAGNDDLLTNYYVYNCQSHYSTLTYSLSGAALGRYFVDLFDYGVGLKTYALMQLKGLPNDPTVTTANIGDVTQPGGVDNLIGWNNNVYAGMSIPTMQYGTMTSSTSNKLIYLDQIVGADYLRATVQAALVDLLLEYQTKGGIPYYDNVGIQLIVNRLKSSLNKGVDQKIIQPFSDADIVYATYEQVPAADKAARLYQQLVANLTLLSRIQKIKLTVTLAL